MDIPTQIIKLNIDISFEIFHSDVNKTIEMFSFHSCMKMAKVTLIYKKTSPPLKDNCCPASIFPNLLKVFQRCLHEQVSPFLVISPQKFNMNIEPRIQRSKVGRKHSPWK